ncbi:MAG: arabinofuranosidase catalytic domain-containing protein [Janthinobacterium lividum]
MHTIFASALTVLAAGAATSVYAGPSLAQTPGQRSQGPCDVYGAAGVSCVAAHSTTRALYASYTGPLYQVLRADGKTLDILAVRGTAAEIGGYADAAAQDAFCSNTTCFISIIYDQSGKKNHLYQAPRGAFFGQGLGGFNNLPVADAAPVTLMGHKVYGVLIVPGSGMRLNDATGTAVDDQAEGQYWVINGQHFNSGCCFDYGNAELHSHDDGDGTMETTYFGNGTGWYHGSPPGPWVMTDQENNLVGCVNSGSTSKLCAGLPTITSRFVTAMAKGRPGRWASLGGDAQHGKLQVMFDGPRIDLTYDPMRKQGAILLGNGGDNSISSQGTFYEGAMTAAGTYPSHEVDQQVQANVVAARYDLPMVTVAPAALIGSPPGLQTFFPHEVKETAVRFTNTTGSAISNLSLNLAVPAGWTAKATGGATSASVAPGATVTGIFRVTSAATPFNGDMVAKADWQGAGKQSWQATQRLRNAPAVKINEFRIGEADHPTNSFIELYNSGENAVDISNWVLRQHQIWMPVTSDIRIPAGTKLAAAGFYVLGLANSGLAVPTRAGDETIYVRSVDGLKVGGAILVGDETRHIKQLGTAAGAETTLWQPMPDGRSVMTVKQGSTNVPVASVDGFKAGEKIALGYGTTYPATYRNIERFEVATLTTVGKPGAYAYLAVDAPTGATNISVTNVVDISVGDQIRLDINSVGHGIETVTVKSVGTAANLMMLVEGVKSGATSFRVRPGGSVFNASAVRSGGGIAALAPGQTLKIGNPGHVQTVTISAVQGDRVTVTQAVSRDYLASEHAVDPGTGLELTAPLKFTHAGNLPFSNKGTGLSYQPASAFERSTNEPILPLGTGLTLDRPLMHPHAINDAVRVDGITTAGYQGPGPNQWFGGPSLSPAAGVIALSDASGHIVDSLNYGLIVESALAEGYQAASGTGAAGCRAPAAGGPGGRGATLITNSSAGRFPDGRDTDSNCDDFVTQAASVLPIGASAGSNNLKVQNVAGFAPGQSIAVGSGQNAEMVVIASVGTAGAVRSGGPVAAGQNVIPVGVRTGFSSGNQLGFVAGQAVNIGDGADIETTTVVAVHGGPGGPRMTIAQPLRMARPEGTLVAGTGITLQKALIKAHGANTQASADQPTPGAANRYSQRN